MNGPVSTRLVFIYQLSSLQLHTKVRFLGCVSRYDIAQGRLELEHNCPPLRRRTKGTDSIATSRKVSVDIYHVIKTVTRDQLQVGSWLNIFGYVRSETHESGNSDNSQFYVEAVMITDAGAIHVAEYEQSLADMQAIDSKLHVET